MPTTRSQSSQKHQSQLGADKSGVRSERKGPAALHAAVDETSESIVGRQRRPRRRRLKYDSDEEGEEDQVHVFVGPAPPPTDTPVRHAFATPAAVCRPCH